MVQTVLVALGSSLFVALAVSVAVWAIAGKRRPVPEEVAEFNARIEALFEPKAVLGASRLRRVPQLPGYQLAITLENHGLVPLRLVEGYVLLHFASGEQPGTRWYPSLVRERVIAPAGRVRVVAAISAHHARRLRWPATVQVGFTVQRGLEQFQQVWHLRVQVDPGSCRRAALLVSEQSVIATVSSRSAETPAAAGSPCRCRRWPQDARSDERGRSGRRTA